MATERRQDTKIRLKNILAGLSFAVAFVMAHAWFESYFQPFSWICFAQENVEGPVSSFGGIQFGRLYARETVHLQYLTSDPFIIPPAFPFEPMPPVVWKWAGFERRSGKFAPRSACAPRRVDAPQITLDAQIPVDVHCLVAYKVWTIPYWFVTPFFLVLPLKVFVQLVKQRIADDDAKNQGAA